MNNLLLREATKFIADNLELSSDWKVDYVGTGHLTVSTLDGFEADTYKVILNEATGDVKLDHVESFSRGESSHASAKSLAVELDTKLVHS